MYHSINQLNFKKVVLFLLITGFFQSGLALPADSNLVKTVQTKISYYYPNKIDVSADANGRVELQGEVNVLYDKLNIFDIVSHIRGVKYIENNIDVNTEILPDNMIVANIENSLSLMNTISDPDSIHFNADNGVIFITGKVRFYKESQMAETMVSWQSGVKSVVNELIVEPTLKAVDDENLMGAIDYVLKDHFPLEKKVSYTVKTGQVNLNGNVNSLWAKINIEKDIKQIVGVKSLKNNLNVVTQVLNG